MVAKAVNLCEKRSKTCVLSSHSEDHASIKLLDSYVPKQNGHKPNLAKIHVKGKDISIQKSL